MPKFEMPTDTLQEGPEHEHVEQSRPDEAPGAFEPSPDRAQRALRWAAGLAGGALVGAAVATYVWDNSQQAHEARAAQEVSDIVDAHLAAVEAGDYRAAADMSDLDPIWADPRFLDAGLQPDSRADVACEAPDVGTLTATVDCEIAVDVDSAQPERSTRRLLLEKLNDQWALVEGLAVEVRLFPSLQRVESISGATLPPSLQRGTRPFWLFPGVYNAVTTVPEQLEETSEANPLIVTSQGGRTQYSPGHSPAVTDDAMAAAIGAVEACASEPSLDCPEQFDLEPGLPLQVESMETVYSVDDTYAYNFIVAVPARGAGTSMALVDVRVDFGENLDRYDISTTVRTP